MVVPDGSILLEDGLSWEEARQLAGAFSSPASSRLNQTRA